MSEVGRDRGNYISTVLSDSTAEQSNPASRRFFSFLAQSASQPPLHNSQQHHNHHGVVRLFLVISAFFLCWTPYIGVALVQAAETAISGQTSLIPPFAVTFSYWLVLLNSDINPLLYALLSKRFQGALQGLRQKIRARLGSVVARGVEVRAEGDDGRICNPCTLTNTHLGPSLTSDSSNSNDSKYSSIFTVSSDCQQHSEECLCRMCHPENTSSSSMCTGMGGDMRVDCLQVPAPSQEHSRLPFSALTKERQGTFFYGQITVTVEHDVC